MRYWDREPRRQNASTRVRQPITAGRTSASSAMFKQRPLFSNPLNKESYERPAPIPEANMRLPDVEPTDVRPGGTSEIERKEDTAKYTYAITNLTTDRTYDANGSSVNELADIVGTLIRDLAAGRKISVDV